LSANRSHACYVITLICLAVCGGPEAIYLYDFSMVKVHSALLGNDQLKSFQVIQSTSQNEAPFNYMVIILMENKNYTDIVHNPMAPYINRLATDYGVSSNYFDVSRNGSLPNYLSLTTSQTYHSWSTCNDPPSQCLGFTPILDPTIIDSIESAGLTWKAYMEDMPGNCYPYDSGSYVVRHNPFVYFGRVMDTPAECNRVVPAGAQADLIISDLASISTASNFMWLTPNLCDDMHDCSVSFGDQYLSQIVPRILDSEVFLTQKAALFLTWDEGWISSPTNIPAIWAGPFVKNNFTSAIRHDHYSFLKTVEIAWHLPSLTSNDLEASAMTEFFADPSSGFSYSPSDPQPNITINFSGRAAGGSSPYSFSWSFGDGGIATGGMTSHEYMATGSYKVTLSVMDAFNNTALSVTTIDVSRASAPRVQPSFLYWLQGEIPMTIMAGASLITVAGGLLASRAQDRRKTRPP
jgi:phosphatidylinositol-3-phosphatase